MKRNYSLLLGVVFTSALACLPAQAQTFFGEDLNTVPGNNSNPPLIPHPFDGTSNTPNSDSAQSSFLGILSGSNYGMENFEDSPIGAVDDVTGIPLEFDTVQGATITATFFGDGGGISGIRNTSGNGAYNLTKEMGAAKYALIAAFPDNPQEARIVFDQDVAGFGFSANDIGDQDGTLILDLYNDGVLVAEFPIDVTSPTDLGQPSQYTSGSVIFAGGANLGYFFDEVRFDLQAGALTPPSGDGFGLDDLIIEAEITTPEPSALIGLGLLGAAGFASRRKKATK